MMSISWTLTPVKTASRPAPRHFNVQFASCDLRNWSAIMKKPLRNGPKSRRLGKPLSVMALRRAEVRYAELSPVRGAEADKRRPVVIVSNNGANTASARNTYGVVTVVPMTTNIARILPFQVFVSAEESGLPHDSKLQAEQVRSLSVDRLGDRVGNLAPSSIRALDEALRLHLSL